MTRYMKDMAPLGLLMVLLSFCAAAAEAPAITIDGVSDELADNIRSQLRLAAEPCETPLPRLLRLLPQARSDAENGLEALGYYHSDIKTDLTREENCWALHIAVMPGAPILLDEITIAIQGDQATRDLFGDLVENNILKKGRQLDHGEYEQVKNRLSALAVERGFFAARFLKSEVQVDLVSDLADVVINFDPGQRFRFGLISIETGGSLSDRFVRSMVPFAPGDFYSSDDLVALRRNLDRSQYFRQISINPRLALARQQAIPVEIDLVPYLRRSYTAGLGFTTDTGPRMRLGYIDRYVNQKGHRFDGNSTLSPVRSELNLNYMLPLENSTTESLNFSGGVIHEDNDTFNSDRFKLEGSYRNESDSGWQRKVFVNFLLDEFNIDVQNEFSQLTVLGADIARTQTDDIINPSRGWKLFAQVRGSSSLLSDVSFMQIYGSAKSVLALGPGRVLSRLEVGSTWVGDQQELPVSVRFFSGGDQSVRAHDYQTLGPLNENGQVIGGRHLLVGSVEYDFPVRPDWRLALFYDAGNAFANLAEIKVKHTLGLGVRWLTPIGPIRLDFAQGLGRTDGFRIHITMGPDL
ncbi:MAG: autotransporter assembly complex family protein [Pseudomonadales bacterium]|nr:autotransporter assembly complex family protein [Pseudomonadales bacterium]